MPHRERFTARAGRALNAMKIVSSLAVLTALVGLEQLSPSVRGAEEDGVAVAILYDTSGSMKQSVPHAQARVDHHGRRKHHRPHSGFGYASPQKTGRGKTLGSFRSLCRF